MYYHEFKTAFEARLQTHANLYPHAVEYYHARFNQTIQYLLSSILEQTDILIQQSETSWSHTEEIVSDILYCGEITIEQLFALEIPNQLTADRDFEAVKTKLYETKYYPISEHLNYISFPPALERKAFIGKHLDCFKGTSCFCDLGFGPGVLTAFILQQNASWRVDGVDVSQHCLQHAQRLLTKKGMLDRSELSVGDIRSLSYPDNTFDVVIAVEVLEHIPDPETGLLASVTLDNAVDVNGLQVGMIPAEQVVRVEQPDGTARYEKQQVGFSSGQDDNIVISPDPAGLTPEEIAQLQDLAAAGAFAEFGNQINIQPSIRFAPVISIGALLTVLCQGPFYLKLMQLF